MPSGAESVGSLAVPSVSIAMAAFNAEAYIVDSVASALRQSIQDLELIVVDDGSRDRTLSLLQEAAARDPRIRVLSQQNQGPAAARNLAILQSRGEFIAFLDADDLWASDKLAKQLPLFQDPEVGMVYSRVQDIDGSGNPTRGTEPWGFHRGRVLEALLEGNFICTSSVVVRRSVLEHHCLRFQVGRVCEDWLLWCRIAARADMEFCSEPLVSYRVHGGGLSRKILRMQDGEIACRMDMVRSMRDREGRQDLDFDRLLRTARRGLHRASYAFARHAMKSGRTPSAWRHWRRSVATLPFRLGAAWRVLTLPMRILAWQAAGLWRKQPVRSDD